MTAAAQNYVTQDHIRDFHSINQALTRLNLPVLSESTHMQLIAQADIQRLTEAFNKAPNQPNAHTYVLRAVTAVQPGDAPADLAAQSNVSNMEDHRQRQQSPGAPSTSQPENPDQPKREFINHHVYGGKAALCFEADTTTQGTHTLCIQSAPAISERNYDWKNKITIQCTRDEMPAVACVFFGLLGECEFSNHGPQNNKGFKIANQQSDNANKDHRIFVQVRTQGASHAVPISPADAYSVGALILRQLRKEHPQIASMQDAINMLKHTYLRLRNVPKG